ncbi:unnamed protein product, partial [Closterium sp. NIES-53]
GVDFFQTFSPTPKMTTLWVLLHVAAQRDYELHSLDFSTAFLQGSLHEEIWLRRPPGFTGSFPAGTQWSLRRPVYGLRQAPREWHDTLKTTLAALGFAPSTSDPSLFLRTDTTLPPFYVLVYVDDLVFATADTDALAHVKSFSASASRTPRHSPLLCLPVTRSQLHLRMSPTSGMGLVLGGRARVVLTGHADASWVDDLATQRSSQGYTFSLGSGSVSWRSTRSSSVLSFSCEAEIYAGAMAAQELRWLTYLLIDLGEAPRSPPVLYIDNKAMLALCHEHRLEHRTKHIALRYFLARELQQRGQLRLAYVASQVNTADVFTKALQPCDHQRFCTVLGLGRSGASPVAPVKSIVGGQRDVQHVDVRVKLTPPGEEQAKEVQPTVVKSAKGAGTRQQLTGKKAAAKPTKKQSATRQSAEEPTTGEKSAGKPTEVQQDDEGSGVGDDGGDTEESTDTDMMEV